jgi:predicted dehydrogenase
MRFSIIGTGFIFPTHIQSIKSVGGEIVEAIGERSLLSWQKIIKNPQTNCIVILAPNHLHYEMVLASAKEEKIVLCEKPLALSSKEVKELMNYSNIFTVAQL